MSYQLHHGDCIEVMRGMEDCSVDAVVTDPPYGLGFMGKAWDDLPPGREVFEECLRVLKPGGHLVAFGGARTYHRMATAVEDAGLEIRDQIMWLYGSGMPKSHNLEGGLGTALKPAHEPIVLARRPLSGTVAGTVDRWGTGALRIDPCRIPTSEPSPSQQRRAAAAKSGRMGRYGGSDGERFGKFRSNDDEQEKLRHYLADRPGENLGRWPANVLHDGSEEVRGAFPAASGHQGDVTGTEPSGKMGSANCYGRIDRRHEAIPRAEIDRSAARFFYCAKADRADRDEGCEELAERPLHWSSGGQNPGSFQSDNTRKSARNNHPTVKPTDLMRWLILLITPPGGTVLDPFMGSGSTGKAAVREGFVFIGIEADEHSAAIAEKRIEAANRQPSLFEGTA